MILDFSSPPSSPRCGDGTFSTGGTHSLIGQENIPPSESPLKSPLESPSKRQRRENMSPARIVGGMRLGSPSRRPVRRLPPYLETLGEISTPVSKRASSMNGLSPTRKDLSVGDFGEVLVFETPDKREFVIKTVSVAPQENLNSANSQLKDKKATPLRNLKSTIRAYEEAREQGCPVVYPLWVEHDQPADPNSPEIEAAFENGQNPYLYTHVRMCFPKGEPLMTAIQDMSEEQRREVADEAVKVYQTVAVKLNEVASDPKPDNLVIIGGVVKAIDFDTEEDIGNVQWTRAYQFCGGDSELANYRRSLELICRVICAGTEDTIEELRREVEVLPLEQLPTLEGVEDSDGW